MNSSAEHICHQNGVKFIGNGPSFRLATDEINEGFLDDEGIHPNFAGCKKLPCNLQIKDLVECSTKQKWRKPATQKPPHHGFSQSKQ